MTDEEFKAKKREYRKRYYENLTEQQKSELLAYQRKYYAKHYDKIKKKRMEKYAKDKAYADRNRERNRIYSAKKRKEEHIAKLMPIIEGMLSEYVGKDLTPSFICEYLYAHDVLKRY